MPIQIIYIKHTAFTVHMVRKSKTKQLHATFDVYSYLNDGSSAAPWCAATDVSSVDSLIDHNGSDLVLTCHIWCTLGGSLRETPLSIDADCCVYITYMRKFLTFKYLTSFWICQYSVGRSVVVSARLSGCSSSSSPSDELSMKSSAPPEVLLCTQTHMNPSDVFNLARIFRRVLWEALSHRIFSGWKWGILTTYRKRYIFY